MANNFPKLSSPCQTCCDCCQKPLPSSWSVDLSTLGLVNGSCDACEGFNQVYVMDGGPSNWNYASSPFCRYADGQGRLYAGLEGNSTNVAWGGAGPACYLTRTPTSDGGCLWQLTYWIGSGCQALVCASLITNTTPFPDIEHCHGGSWLFWRNYQYHSPIGELCNIPKTLTAIPNPQPSNLDGPWVHMYEANGPFDKAQACCGFGTFCDDSMDPANGGPSFTMLDPFCLAGPNFPNTVTVEPGD